jgi:hypothetical protein
MCTNPYLLKHFSNPVIFENLEYRTKKEFPRYKGTRIKYLEKIKV